MTPNELYACRMAFEAAYPHVGGDFGSLFMNSYTSLGDQERWESWRKCWQHHVLKPSRDVTDKGFHP